jgi:hypothetical protein
MAVEMERLRRGPRVEGQGRPDRFRDGPTESDDDADEQVAKIRHSHQECRERCTDLLGNPDQDDECQSRLSVRGRPMASPMRGNPFGGLRRKRRTERVMPAN